MCDMQHEHGAGTPGRRRVQGTDMARGANEKVAELQLHTWMMNSVMGFEGVYSVGFEPSRTPA